VQSVAVVGAAVDTVVVGIEVVAIEVVVRETGATTTIGGGSLRGWGSPGPRKMATSSPSFRIVFGICRRG
jgi:hypothetical protein